MMHPVRTLLFALTILLTASGAAQNITVKDLMQAGACRDLPCFKRFAMQKGYAATDSITENGSTTVIYLPRKAGPDDLSPELGITLAQEVPGSGTIPSVHYACYDKAVYELLLRELATMGFEASDEPVDIGAGLMTDHMAPDHPELNVWTLIGELDAETGRVTYYKLGLANAE